MDLSTTYLGFTLPHPLIPGASPLADEIDTVKRLEDAGAPALVLRSLFEEQVTQEQMAEHHLLDGPGESFAEAMSYFPGPDVFLLSTDRYLEHLRRIILERRLAPHASDAELRHLEGQRYAVAYIIALVERGSA